MSTSITFNIQRAQASSAAQSATGASKIGDFTVDDLDKRIAAIMLRGKAESSTRIGLQGVAALWDGHLKEVFDISRHATVLSKKRFSADPTKLAYFNNINPSDDSRAIIAKVGTDVAMAWEKADPAWVPVEGATLPELNRLLKQSEDDGKEHAKSLALWRTAASELNGASDSMHQDNVAWYASATRQFKEGTPYGDMIRSTVPVTTDTVEPVGTAVIKNVVVAGNTASFEAEAPHATAFTYLHKAPGDAVFSVVKANTAEKSMTLGGLTPGEHRIKAFGANSQGIGPESTEAVVAIAQANAA